MMGPNSPFGSMTFVTYCTTGPTLLRISTMCQRRSAGCPDFSMVLDKLLADCTGAMLQADDCTGSGTANDGWW